MSPVGNDYSVPVPAADKLRAAVDALSRRSAALDSRRWWIYHENTRRKIMYAKYHIRRVKEIKGQACRGGGPVGLFRKAAAPEFSVPLHAHVEAFLVTICSAFDSLAHELNVLLELGVPEDEVVFRGIRDLMKERGEAAEAPVRDTLDAVVCASEFSELERFRNYAVHSGQVMLQEHVVSKWPGLMPGLYLLLPDDPDPRKSKVGSIPDQVSRWLETIKGREVEEWCRRMLDFAATRVDSCYSRLKDVLRAENVGPEDRSNNRDVYRALDRRSPEYRVVQFLRNLRDCRYDFAHRMLAPEWQAQETLDSFRTRWKGTQVLKFYLGQSWGTTDRANCTVRLTVQGADGLAERVQIVTIEKRGGGWKLVPNDFNLPSPATPRLSAPDLRRRQSGPETGHRDIAFEATITNVSKVPLVNVRATVYQHEWTDIARQDVGDLPPGESRALRLVFKGAAAIPLIGARPLYEPSRLRLVYRLEDGGEWSEDLPFPPAVPRGR